MKRTTLAIKIVLSALCALALACHGDREREAISRELADLRTVAARLEYENGNMWQDIRVRIGDEPYIVVDTIGNKLSLRKGERALMEAIVSTGSGKLVEEKGGRKWIFTTPKGTFTVLGKERDPVWYKPDWAYVEDKLPIPPPNSQARMVRGILGKYALSIGGSYKIHGTPYKRFLGQSVSHGCIRLKDEDMETLYNQVALGTKVYIY